MKNHVKVKIKVKSLAEEQRIIRREENKEKWNARAARGRIRFKKAQAELARVGYIGKQESDVVTGVDSLHLHRVKNVRRELRSANLAYGFLRGIPYAAMEQFSWTQPDWNRVQRLAEKYSEDNVEKGAISQQYAEWMQSALNGFTGLIFQTTKDFRDKRHPGSRKVIDQWVQSRPGYHPGTKQAA